MLQSPTCDMSSALAEASGIGTTVGDVQLTTVKRLENELPVFVYHWLRRCDVITVSWLLLTGLPVKCCGFCREGGRKG